MQANLTRDYESAIGILERALMMNGNSALAFGFSALANAHSEHHDRAIEQVREAITAALESAADVDLHGLAPAWTPRGGTGEGLLGAVSNPWYYQVNFDPEANDFVVEDDLLNVVEEFAGTLDYPQP